MNARFCLLGSQIEFPNDQRAAILKRPITAICIFLPPQPTPPFRPFQKSYLGFLQPCWLMAPPGSGERVGSSSSFLSPLRQSASLAQGFYSLWRKKKRKKRKTQKRKRSSEKSFSLFFVFGHQSIMTAERGEEGLHQEKERGQLDEGRLEIDNSNYTHVAVPSTSLTTVHYCRILSPWADPSFSHDAPSGGIE